MKQSVGLTFLLLCLLSSVCAAQSTPSQECTPETPPFTSASVNNIFDDRQEQDLGDALAEMIESDLHIAPPEANDELSRIGERLLATLPPTGVHYRFRIYESGEINGFSIAGGRVYISRKLLAAVKSEDELAGVLAHEIGHLYAHQVAIEMSRALRVRLGITKVTDRANIFAAIHKFFNTPSKSGEWEDSEEKSQLDADRISIYAMVRAGYSPDSFTAFFDKVTVNQGNTGSWFSNLFGITHENTKRYREARKLVETLPTACRAKQPSASDKFASWLQAIAQERVKTVAEGIEADKPLKLDNPIRPTLWRVRFSPDGRYLLAQDEGSIAVIDRAAAKVMFRIDAPNAERAQFTPDSSNIVFHDRKLRVETWSIATGTRTSAKELVVYGGCEQTLLAPDGKSFLCLSFSSEQGVGVHLIDVENGKPFFEKQKFYQPNGAGIYVALWFANAVRYGYPFASAAISPDGRYLLTVVGHSVAAFDLHTHEPVVLSGKLKGLEQSQMTFVGPDRLLLVSGVDGGKKMYKTRLLSFPDGKVIKEGLVGDQQFESATDGKLLEIWPLKDYNEGLLDIETNNVVWLSKLLSLDAWGGMAAGEGATGGIELSNLSDGKLAQRIPLPLTPLPRLSASHFSSDGKYLAVSMKYRASIWDLNTGKQVGLIRPFKSGWIDGDGHFFAQSPKYLSSDPEEELYDLGKFSAKALGKLDKDAFQYRDLELILKPMGKGDDTENHVTLDVKKMATQAVLWTKDFPRERPAIWAAEDNRMVMGWDMASDWAKQEIKSHPALQPIATALENKKRGLLIETFAPETGAPIEQTIVPEADLTGGWDDVRRAIVSAKFVVTRGEHGNTGIYRLDDGAKIGEFFGIAIAVDARANLIAAVNRDDEIVLVEEQTGKELKRFSLGSPVRAARIVAGNDGVLLVYTADQVVHRLPLPETPAVAAAPITAAQKQPARE